MPASTPDSSDSPSPSAMPSAPADAARAAPWRTNAWLFVATIAAVFVTGFVNYGTVRGGLAFTGSLLLILVAHEAGHYVAARVHKVDASLPYFIPFPLLSPFGTMGAIIRMRGTIPTRRALLDIGASGPLAGLIVAIPLYLWGAAHSTFLATDAENTVSLGESLLSRLLDHVAAPTPPPGMELMLSPVAFGAWGGLFVTMINLIPVGQLDGGHVAYALFGRRQDKFGVVVHRAMLAFFFVSLFSYVARDVRAGIGLHHVGTAISNSMFWFVWFEVMAVLGTLATRAQEGPSSRAADEGIPVRTRVFATLGLVVLPWAAEKGPTLFIAGLWAVGLALLLVMEVRSGTLRKHALLDHPPTGAAPLDPVRRAVAIVTLAFFVLLFMPTPMAM